MKTSLLLLFGSYAGLFAAISCLGLLLLGIAVAEAQSPGQQPRRDIEITTMTKISGLMARDRRLQVFEGLSQNEHAILATAPATKEGFTR